MALPGFAKYFKAAADEEKEHAEALMKFQIQRGGRICLEDIKKPIKNEWGSGLEAMQEALELEKFMNQTLLDLHKTANKHSDFQVYTIAYTASPHALVCLASFTSPLPAFLCCTLNSGRKRPTLNRLVLA